MMSENWNLPLGEDGVALGASLYRQHCESCHRPNGEGVAGLYPPLVGTDWVTGSKDRLTAIALRGLSVPITVKGAVYEQEMPTFVVLDDEEIAAVLTFIRQEWGNDAGAVQASEVAEERRLLEAESTR